MESVWAEETLQREEGCDALLLRRTNVGGKKKNRIMSCYSFFFSFFFFVFWTRKCAVGRGLLMNHLLFFSSIKASSSLNYGDGEQRTIAPPFAPPYFANLKSKSFPLGSAIKPQG